MNKKKLIIIVSVILSIIAIIAILFFSSLNPVSKKSEVVNFTVANGDSKKTIVDNLKNADLIKNEYSALIYIFISGKTNIQAGNYELNRNMSVNDIIEVLSEGKIKDAKKEEVSITFKEGKTLKEYLKLVAENTNLEYDTICEEINNKDFLKKLIDEYWFLDDEILNSDIYYSLEGYLYPNTYNFYVDTTLETVVKKMLDETSKKMEPLKNQINNSSYSVHEILTMASIIEKEAINYEDRTKVSQVIYKRLSVNMNLGMDVTTYYGVQKDMKEILTDVDLNDKNPYNTRRSDLIGLPIGPICNPSFDSIKAALNPSNTNYLYFFADIVTGNVYFTADYNEFLEFKRLYG